MIEPTARSRSLYARVRIRSVSIGARVLGLLGVLGIFAATFEQDSVARLFFELGETPIVLGAFVAILIAAGVFGLTFFEGLSLQWRFAALRKAPADTDATPMVIQVLRSLTRVRVMAVLLMLVGVAPFLKQFDLGSRYYYYQADRQLLAIWSGNQQIWAAAGLILWILGCGWVLMLARRAVWDFWFAGGGAADGEVGRAFAVMMPSFPSEGAPREISPVPVIPMARVLSPRGEEEASASQDQSRGPEPSAINSGETLPPIVPSVTVASLPPDFNISRAELSLSRYEQALFVLLLACLVVCIFRLPWSFEAAERYSKLSTWEQVWDRFANGAGFGSPYGPTSGTNDIVAGAMGVAIIACSLMIWGVQLVVIVWVIQCLLLGPRYLRAAILCAGAVTFLLMLRASLAACLSNKSGLDPDLIHRGIWPFSTGSLSIPSTLVTCLLPAAAILLLRSNAVHTLSRVRPGKRSQKARI